MYLGPGSQLRPQDPEFWELKGSIGSEWLAWPHRLSDLQIGSWNQEGL